MGLFGMNCRISGVLSLSLGFWLLAGLIAAQRLETFDRDPGWEGQNNRSAIPPCRSRQEDFGYSPLTAFAGGGVGEIGGRVERSATRAAYAKAIKPRTLDEAL